MSDTKAIIRRFYDIWNSGALRDLPEVLAEDAVFRGSFDIDTRGIEAFREYAGMMTEAFPDLRITVDTLIAEGSSAAVQLTTTGTHKGQLFEFPATGRSLTFRSAAFFTVNNGKIAESQMVGDIVAMLDQLILESAQDGEDEDYDDEEEEYEAGKA